MQQLIKFKRLPLLLIWLLQYAYIYSFSYQETAKPTTRPVYTESTFHHNPYSVHIENKNIFDNVNVYVTSQLHAISKNKIALEQVIEKPIVEAKQKSVLSEAKDILNQLKKYTHSERNARNIKNLRNIKNFVITSSYTLNNVLQKTIYDLQQIIHDSTSGKFKGMSESNYKKFVKIIDAFEKEIDKWQKNQHYAYQDCWNDLMRNNSQEYYATERTYNLVWEYSINNHPFNKDVDEFIRLCDDNPHSEQVQQLLNKYSPKWSNEKSYEHDLLKKYHRKSCKKFAHESKQKRAIYKEEQQKLFEQKRSAVLTEFFANERLSNFHKNMEKIHNIIELQSNRTDHSRFSRREQAIRECKEKLVEEKKFYSQNQTTQAFMDMAHEQSILNYFIGNQLQHVFHEEHIAIIDKVGELCSTIQDPDILDLGKRIILCVKSAHIYNLNGFTNKALTLNEFCWSSLKYMQEPDSKDLLSKAAKDFEKILQFLEIDHRDFGSIEETWNKSDDIRWKNITLNDEWKSFFLAKETLHEIRQAHEDPDNLKKIVCGQEHVTAESLLDRISLRDADSFFLFPKETWASNVDGYLPTESFRRTFIQSTINSKKIPLHIEIAKEASRNLMQHKNDYMKRVATDMQILQDNEANQWTEHISDPCYEARLKSLQESVQSGTFTIQNFELIPEGARLLQDLGLDDKAFTRSYGNQLQHILCKQFVDIINNSGKIYSKTSNGESRELAKRAVIYSDIGNSFLKEGFILRAVYTADFCWSLLDCSVAIGEKIFDAVAHPFETIRTLAEAISQSSHSLTQLLNSVGFDQKRVLEKYFPDLDSQTKEAVIEFGDKLVQEGSELVKNFAVFEMESALLGKLFTATGKFFNEASKLAKGIEKVIAITAEGLGVQAKIAEKVTSSFMQKIGNSGAAKSLEAIKNSFKIAIEGIEEILPEIAILNSNKQHHILFDKHVWGRLVKDPRDWDAVARLMSKTLREGVEFTTDNPEVFDKILKIGGEEILVRYSKFANNIIKVSNGWIKV